MTTYFLRMEGVNLANVVGDTQDLSTIRGGGLLLLDAIKEADQIIPGLEALSSGASTGMFSFEAANSEKAKEFRDLLMNHFNDHVQYRHCTFVIDVMESTGDFVHDREALIAANRLRQIQSPSLAIPAKDNRCISPCAVDLVRPEACDTKHYGQNGLRISESVYQRRKYGSDKKQRFYKEETGLSGLPSFVTDLGSLSCDMSKGNLHNKLAVIYLDGNGFGKLQSACRTPDELKTFDREIKEKRREFLKALFEEKICRVEDWLFRNENTGAKELRFEILLWGGDEMILVVPAWKGWETLQFFYQKTEDWKHGDQKLFHGGGLVFCHHKAHIHRITALARELGELAKYDRNRSLFVHKSLESFDHIGQSAERYFENSAERYLGKKDFQQFVLEGRHMSDIAKHISTLKRAEFPRSRIYRYLKETHGGLHADAADTISSAIDECSCQDAARVLPELLNGDIMQWLHVAELWDYIPVASDRSGHGGVR